MKETDKGFQALRTVMRQGLIQGSTALSAMSTGGVHLQNPTLRLMPLSRIPEIAGGPASVVVAVYLGIHGDLNGHVVLLFQEKAALRVSEMLMGLEPGSMAALDDLGLSAIAEAGNVCCGACLSALADRTGLVLLPTPPTVVEDMAGAILDAVVTHLYLVGDESLVVETKFNDEIPGYFLFLLDQNSMAKLVVVLETMS